MTEYRRTVRKTVTSRKGPFGPAEITEEEDETFIEGSSDEIIKILNDAEYKMEPVLVTFDWGKPGVITPPGEVTSRE
jgi:hypothetical protein